MCHILDQAIDYINSMDTKPIEYDYTCDCCGDGFDKGHGVSVTDEKFCNECVLEHKHYFFYHNCGAYMKEINIFIEENIVRI